MTAPTTQTTTLDEAFDHIAAEPAVWLRVAAVRHDDGAWHARLLELTSGEAPPSWELRSWEYPSTLFAAACTTGDTITEWLRAGKLILAVGDITVSEFHESVRWERRQSRSSAAYESLPWPTVEANFSQTAVMNQSEPQGHLVPSHDAPSFVNFYTAGACYFFLDRQPIGGSLQPGVVYRHQDTRARINRVRITDTAVDVDIEGTALEGTVAELASDTPGSTVRLWDRGHTAQDAVTFGLTDGLPAGAWVLLRRGREWIDRRFLSVPWTRDADAGVEMVVEPRTKLEGFLVSREGPQVEFKRQIPDGNEAKAKTMKTACAFANGIGGSILFGIDDEHTVLGLPNERIGPLKDQLTQVVDSWLEPSPTIEFDLLPTGDGSRVVLELSVSPGTALYGCRSGPGEAPVVYIRHYATTVKARPGEIEEIVRKRNQSLASSPSAFLR